MVIKWSAHCSGKQMVTKILHTPLQKGRFMPECFRRYQYGYYKIYREKPLGPI